MEEKQNEQQSDDAAAANLATGRPSREASSTGHRQMQLENNPLETWILWGELEL